MVGFYRNIFVFLIEHFEKRYVDEINEGNYLGSRIHATIAFMAVVLMPIWEVLLILAKIFDLDIPFFSGSLLMQKLKLFPVVMIVLVLTLILSSKMYKNYKLDKLELKNKWSKKKSMLIIFLLVLSLPVLFIIVGLITGFMEMN